MMPAGDLVGSHDLLLVTLDALRHDVAAEAMAAGQTPRLADLFPTGWERRQTPGSFTLPAHLAFLAGFLPTPDRPGRHPRPFVGDFPGRSGAVASSFRFAEAGLPEALAARGYHTACLGGVGFFSGRGALGSILPSRFAESSWSPSSGVGNPDSPTVLFGRAAALLAALPAHQRAFLLLNVAATHPPTQAYLAGSMRDSPATQQAALTAVDSALPLLLAPARRRPTMLIVCSDHGTCFGEDGQVGHGFAHPLVWTVPYAETWWDPGTEPT